MVPRLTCKSTPSTATNPLNSRGSPCVSRMMSSAMPATDSAAPPGLMSARLSPLPPGLAMAMGSIIPVRRPLFDKCVDTFMRVRIQQAARHNAANLTVGGLQAEIDLAVEGLLALADQAC